MRPLISEFLEMICTYKTNTQFKWIIFQKYKSFPRFRRLNGVKWHHITHMRHKLFTYLGLSSCHLHSCIGLDVKIWNSWRLVPPLSVETCLVWLLCNRNEVSRAEWRVRFFKVLPPAWLSLCVYLSSVQPAGPVLSCHRLMYTSAPDWQVAAPRRHQEPPEVLLHGQRDERRHDARTFLLAGQQWW